MLFELHTDLEMQYVVCLRCLTMLMHLINTVLVFQSKVLQRLYPAAPKLEKEPSPPCIVVESLAKKTCVKKKAIQEHTAAGKIRILLLTFFSENILSAFNPLSSFQRPHMSIPTHHSCKTAAFLYLSCQCQETRDTHRL